MFLSLQDNESVGPFHFKECTVGRIIRVDANNGNVKEEPIPRSDPINIPKKFNFNNCMIGQIMTVTPANAKKTHANACQKTLFSIVVF